jgi:hypothetical protein
MHLCLTFNIDNNDAKSSKPIFEINNKSNYINVIQQLMTLINFGCENKEKLMPNFKF